MVPEDLSVVLADYAAGLDSAQQLLAQLEGLATRQHHLAVSPAPEQVAALVDERQHVLDGLLALETRLRPLRERIGADLEQARRVPGFQVVADRHRAAAAAVTRIMEVDQQSLDELRLASSQRREDALTVETAGATLAAYRRVLEGPQGSAGLVDERG